jgi:hypothetical protein
MTDAFFHRTYELLLELMPAQRLIVRFREVREITLPYPGRIS